MVGLNDTDLLSIIADKVCLNPQDDTQEKGIGKVDIKEMVEDDVI